MTRVTNLVKRKRKYVNDDDLMVDPDSGEPSSSKRIKSDLGQNSSRSSVSKNSRKGSNLAKGLKNNPSAAASEKRRLRRIDERGASKTCFACRESGHTARDCPNAVSVGEGRSTVGICYRYVKGCPRCGSKKHTLSRCKKPEDATNPLPFAQCFVCSQKGHLSGACPNNTKGLYPNGGGCKLCGQNDHLVKNCPTRVAAPTSSPFLGIVSQDAPDAGADEDDFHAFKRRTNAIVKEEASRERVEKLMRKRPTVTPPSTLPHPDRQALFIGAATSPSQANQFQRGSNAPAFLARGSAVVSSRKTKVVNF